MGIRLNNQVAAAIIQNIIDTRRSYYQKNPKVYNQNRLEYDRNLLALETAVWCLNGGLYSSDWFIIEQNMIKLKQKDPAITCFLIELMFQGQTWNSPGRIGRLPISELPIHNQINKIQIIQP